jgi:hypothetical protein
LASDLYILIMNKLEIIKSLGRLIFIPILAFSGNIQLESHHELVKEVVSLDRSQDYEAAIQLLTDQPQKELGQELGIILAMSYMAQYDEYTTDPSIVKAIAILQKVIQQFKQREIVETEKSPSGDTDALEHIKFWKAFAQMQMGWAYELNGNSINGALLTRKGALEMGQLRDNTDAQALHAIYEYYLGGITSKLPWMEDQRDEHLKVILKGIDSSEYFSDLFRTTAIWIYYDRKEYVKGLRLAQEFLKHHPQHRIYRTITGDMLRKLQNYKESYKVYTDVYVDYSQGNLANGVRSLSALGNIVLLKSYLGTLSSGDSQWLNFRNRLVDLENKMPQSLLDEMTARDLID